MAEPGGVLTLVGTPIGNLGDLTPAALAALRAADVICAEDTRRTRKLLTANGIGARRLTSIRAQNEEREAARVVRWVAEGRAVAYVTDAGMPAVSDPGERLVRAVLAAGGRVAAAPGPDAATAALALSGLPADRWAFEGFLPVKGQARGERLARIAAESRTTVVYEAPHRLAAHAGRPGGAGRPRPARGGRQRPDQALRAGLAGPAGLGGHRPGGHRAQGRVRGGDRPGALTFWSARWLASNHPAGQNESAPTAPAPRRSPAGS